MGSVHLCTPLFFADAEKATHLYLSAGSVGLTVNPYGFGEKWKGFVESKMVGLLNHIEGMVKEEYTLCVDAVDTVVVAGVEEIVTAFLRASNGMDVLVGGDKFCFPNIGLGRKLCSTYSGMQLPIFKYPCAGVVMGKTKELASAIRFILGLRSNQPHRSTGYDDDQGWWQTVIANKMLPVTIDHQCLLSVSMHGCKIGSFGRDGNRLIVNGNRPPILHFNGKPRNKFRVYLRTCK